MTKEEIEMLQELIKKLSRESRKNLILVYSDERSVNRFEIITYRGSYNARDRDVYAGNLLYNCYEEMLKKPTRSQIDT